MARQTFAGDLAAFTAGVQLVGGVSDVLILRRNVTGITAWNALSSGSQVTDLTDLGGSPITGVSSDSNGLFAFRGPDEVYELWLDAGFGARQYVDARLASKLLALITTVSALSATVTGNAAAAVQTTTIDAKGDLLAGTADNALTRLPVGANGRVLTADSGQTSGVKWVPAGRPIAFSIGTVSVGTGTFRWYNNTGVTLTIAAVIASVGTAPVGSSLIVDVNKNGTTIFTTQGNRPSIAAGSNVSSRVTNMDVTTLAALDYLSVDVDQVGSTAPGANLGVQIELVG